ncbi:hypothetical protein [Methanosarcina sp. UBA411]|jgi:hypothetical protein|uniref:hypothetical protein n=1 Tax=Methanosarcina sp. UBA411 TaxID=1915589 RepID=UPI0025F4C872|nr:hypothetical protein [Methanosarcina sp. UBA411]
MERRESYCPLSEKCSHEYIPVEPNSYFLIEPFDELKEKRENGIWQALKTYYNKFGIEPKLTISDLRNSHLKGLYCNICSQIKSSEYCIVDVSGELYNIINEAKKQEGKIFLRSNVAFELGLAYGFNKPTFVLSRKLNGKREFLSDIKFIQYINIEEEKYYESFSEALNQTRSLISIDNLARHSQDKELWAEISKQILLYKKRFPIIKEKNYYINEIVWDRNTIVGIISDSKNISTSGSKELFKGIIFEIYVSQGNFEKKIGVLQVDSTNPKGFAQVSFYNSKDCNNTYLKDIYIHLSKNQSEIYIPQDEHRLVPIIEEHIEKCIENFEV